MNDKSPAAHKPFPMTPGATLSCPRCRLALDPASAAAAAEIACPSCRSALTVRIFPAFTNPPAAIPATSGESAIDGEAACFFHAGKRAATTCDRCGRFLCALCDVPFGGRHLCPLCLDSTKLPELIHRRVVWSHVAAIVGWLPLPMCFVWPVYFFTGPAAVFLALWKWNAPGSLVHGRRRGMAIAAIIGGLLQISAVVGFFAAMFWSIHRQ